MRETELEREERHVPRRPGGLMWLAVLLLAAVVAFLYWRSRETPEAPPVLVPPADEAPLIRHPLPPADRQQGETPQPVSDALAAKLVTPLPALDDSDAALAPLVAYLVKNPALAELLVSKDRIRRIVTTVDSLDSRELPLNRLPANLPPGRFLAVERDGGLFMDTANYPRYAQHLELLKVLDSTDLVRAYVHLYPLFQDAFRELGHPKGYFNDRLVEVIDRLLETPAVEQAPELQQPSLFYVYDDASLENLSAGQKLLLRMGPAQAEEVKGKLREIREALTRSEAGN